MRTMTSLVPVSLHGPEPLSPPAADNQCIAKALGPLSPSASRHPRRSVPAMAAGPGGMGGGVGYCRVSGGGCLLVLAGDAHRVPARVPPVLLLVPVPAPSGPP